MDVRDLKVELQSQGLRVLKGGKGRIGGAGPAGAKIFLFGDTVANIPTTCKFVENSPYSVVMEGGTGILKRGDEELMTLKSPEPVFYDLVTEGGTPYKEIALLHGTDCLATTPIQSCIYWNTRDRCKFCGIGLSREKGTTTAVKKPEEIAEVADAAKRLDGVTHVTLTIGTTGSRDKGIKILSRSASAIKERTGLPVHVQFEPPADLEYIEELRSGGVDSVGVHIESFDRNVLKKVAPAKARIGVKRFIETWERSVEIFGENQVESFILVGLGEEDKSIIEGSRRLSEIGAYPFILSLRPIPGSLMEDAIPAEAYRMKKIYEEVAVIIKDAEVSWDKCKAGCVRCRACSALPDFEV